MSFQSIVPRVALLLAATALLAGCGAGERSAAPQPSDEETVRSLVLNDPAIAPWFAADLFAAASPAQGSPLDLSPIGILASWRRQPEPGGSSQHVDVRVVGSTAWVTTTLTTEGQLQLREWRAGEIVLHTKPMADKGVRYGLMERVGSSWVLREVSPLSVGSCLGGNDPSVSIESVELAAGAVSIEVNDCSLMIPVDAIPSLPAGAMATATIETGEAPGHAYFYMGGRPTGPDREAGITPGPDGTYRVNWRAPLRSGVYTATVDFIEHDAIYESDARIAPYDARSWVITYRVGRGGVN